MKIKRIFKAIVVFCAAFGVMSVNAVPLYYVFEGMPNISPPPAYTGAETLSPQRYLEIMGQSVETPVSYVFYVDDALGRYHNNDYSNGGSIDEFLYHSTLVSGSGINPEDIQTRGSFHGEINSAPGSNGSHVDLGMNSGFESGTYINIEMFPFLEQSNMNSYDDFIGALTNDNLPYSCSHCSTFESAFGISNDDVHARMTFDLALTSISEENPHASVPEPSVFYLFGLGLFSIGFAKRIKKSKGLTSYLNG
ncbi:MAG: PEP-CTERM sorting domain-containing protein [Candidatus Thiodiazotropha sp.]